MTLDQFLAQAPATLASFADATRRAAETDPSMDPNKDRDEAWWWADVGAYLRCLDADETLRRQS